MRPSKNKGQNFLISYGIANQIVKSANIKSNDHILEIGGGIGILTHALHKTKAKLTVIEKEPLLATHLKQTYDDIEVIIGDAVTLEWPSKVRIISNLPFSVSTPILVKLLHHSIYDAIIMLQKEVANRCLANPNSKEYGRLSVLCNIHSHVKKILDVSPEAFFPKPKVQSQILHFEPRKAPIQTDHEKIELLTQNLFSLRRRTVRAVIRGFLKRKNYSSDVWELIPHKSKRIMELSVEMIEEIFMFLKSENAWPLTNP